MGCPIFFRLLYPVFWDSKLPERRAILPPTIRQALHIPDRRQEESLCSPSSDIWDNRRYGVRDNADKKSRPNRSTHLCPPSQSMLLLPRATGETDHLRETFLVGPIELVCGNGGQGNKVSQPAAFSANSSPLDAGVATARSASAAMVAGSNRSDLSKYRSCRHPLSSPSLGSNLSPTPH